MTAAVPNAGGFQTTRWTQVLAARGSSSEAKRALRELCTAYYAPVELFVRRYRGGDEACDLTHEFFAKLLEGNSLGHHRADSCQRSMTWSLTWYDAYEVSPNPVARRVS